MEKILVGYDNAMLLKKCGFDEPCQDFYSDDITYDGKSISFNEQLEIIKRGRVNEIECKSGGKLLHGNVRNSDDWVHEKIAAAPEQHDVTKWLRDTYGIIILIRFAYKFKDNSTDGVEYTFSVYEVKPRDLGYECEEYWDRFEDAVENGINHALNKLIKIQAI